MSVIVFGYYGYNNVGDDQLLIETIRLLNNVNINKIIVAKGPKPLPYPSFNRWNVFLWIKHLVSQQVLVFGGGSIFQSVTGVWSLLYYIGIVQLAWICQCRVILLCHGWGPFKKKWHEQLSAWALRKAYRSWRLPAPSRFSLDPVFCDLTLTQDLPPKKTVKSGIGIFLRSQKIAQQLKPLLQHYPLTFYKGAEGNAALSSTWHANNAPHLFLITDRLHGAIWASRHGIAWVGISTDPKLVHISKCANQPCFSSVEAFFNGPNWESISGSHLQNWVVSHAHIRHAIQLWLDENISH